MIYLVIKNLKIKEDVKANFDTNFEVFLKNLKKQPLNLSADAIWKDPTNAVLVERWSTKKAYDDYLASEEFKTNWSKLTSDCINKPLVLKQTTTN
ncbi:putative quinol monooxygenase [Mycoplasmopsis columbinasalis]|uniref:ABM domain-containing protein n=1 Tax=Mycoplasmopsis columbinasalis TaxID=114880 RepID=A0A449B9Z5_9BACT|nr:antibiotic biosynthesis monooxygenase [Mycoplasmopsis columbinasalis]VEU77994.1 Uncharacterised protein [Mycoplasmopsis columbinasalis]